MSDPVREPVELSPFEAAWLFAIREAIRLRRERRAKLRVMQGGKDQH